MLLAPFAQAHGIQNTDTERLLRASALSMFACFAVFSPTHEAAETWTDAVVPTALGRELLGVIGKEEDPNARMALFGIFFHDAALIDVERSDLAHVQRLLEEELFAGTLRWPDRFGRELYDRYFERFPPALQSLKPDQVQDLLSGASTGVYQIGPWVLGPLGIRKSRHSRFVPPSLYVPLWHCTNTACGELHDTRLFPANVPVVAAYAELVKRARERGPEESWLGAVRALSQGRTPVDDQAEPLLRDRLYDGIGILIGSSIPGEERTKLLAEAIAAYPALRGEIAQPPKRRRDAEGAAQAVAKALSASEQLQLLVLLPNEDLVLLIDNAVHQGRIRVPHSEIRAPKSSTPHRGIELSSWGVRAHVAPPVVRLVHLVRNAYEETDGLDSLQWRLLASPGTSAVDAMLGRLKSSGPESLVAATVLPSAEVTKFVGRELTINTASIERDWFIAQVLWKCGFDVPRHQPAAAHLRRRLDSFYETLVGFDAVRTEADREVLRGSGSNLFVSAERMLEEFVAYNVWLLSSDHFLGTHFVYAHVEAKEAVSRVLGATLGGGESEACSWSINTGNTLGVSLRYASAAVDWMRGLASAERAVVLRPKEELPDFSGYGVRQFPLLHKELWADSTPAALSSFAEEFAAVVKSFQQSGIAAIRNGLEHYRDAEDFPDLDQMLAFVAKFRTALERVETRRLIPSSFWATSSHFTSYSMGHYELEDHRGRKLSIGRPTMSFGLLDVEFDKPLLVAPGDLLPFGNTTLVFRLREPSEYATYWSNYPRRVGATLPAPADGE